MKSYCIPLPLLGCLLSLNGPPVVIGGKPDPYKPLKLCREGRARSESRQRLGEKLLRNVASGNNLQRLNRTRSLQYFP